jgi:rhodanese-related sulfurtransferase
MRKLLFITLLAISAGFAQDSPAAPKGAGRGTPSKAHVLSVAEVDGLLAKPSEVLFIDVRRPDEVSSNGGFPVYLSIQLADLEKSLAYIPKDRTIVTVSNHAARGGKAADLLESKGFKVAGTVGAETYAAAGGHITKIAIPAPTANGVANARK